MPKSFENKVALITGGASGIGFATACAFARKGAKVMIGDLDQARGRQAVREITAEGGIADFCPLDVTRSGNVEEIVAQTRARYRGLDCAFNAAGVIETGSAADCTEEQWARVIGINLTGVWLCMKYQIRAMLEQGSGSIVNAASVIGLVGVGSGAAYTASKHGVVGLTKAAALDCARSGVRINAVCPAYVRTPLLEKSATVNGVFDDRFLSAQIPMGRIGLPEEISGAVLWLCSSEASFVTGMSMPIDGGLVAGTSAEIMADMGARAQ